MENAALVVFDGRHFAVHHKLGPDNFTPKGLSNSLMTETDTKNGNLLMKALNQID